MLSASKWLQRSHGSSYLHGRSVACALPNNVYSLSAHNICRRVVPSAQFTLIRTRTTRDSSSNTSLSNDQRPQKEPGKKLRHNPETPRKRQAVHGAINHAIWRANKRKRIFEKSIKFHERAGIKSAAFRRACMLHKRIHSNELLILYGKWVLRHLIRDDAARPRIASSTSTGSSVHHVRTSICDAPFTKDTHLQHHHAKVVRPDPNHSDGYPRSYAYMSPINTHSGWFRASAKVKAARSHGLFDSDGKEIKHKFAFTSLIRGSNAAMVSKEDSSTLRVWNSLGPMRQRRYWQSALLYSLDTAPETAGQILLTMLDKTPSLIPPPIARNAVTLAVELLIRERRNRPYWTPKADPYRMSLCSQLVNKYMETHKNSLQLRYLLSNSTASVLIKQFDKAQLLAFTSRFFQSEAQSSTNIICLLSLAHAAHGLLESAVDLLSRIPKVEVSRPRVRTTCTKLLAATIEETVDYTVRTDILTYMLELGVVPDETMRDVIIWNAVAAGDRDTAWASHEIAVNKGLKPTVVTYIYLLSNPKILDPQTISRIHRIATQDGLLSRSPQLARRLVDAVAKCFSEQGSRHRFRMMIMMYKDLFDLQPLQDIGIFNGPIPTRSKMSLSPDAYTLSIMVWGWIMAQKDPQQIVFLYRRWSIHTRERSSRISITAENNFLVNTFIMRLGELGDVRMCKEIMENHLKPVHHATLSHEVDPSKPRSTIATKQLLPPPDAVTWNIFLRSLLLNGHDDAAHEVFSIIKSLRYGPTSSTYNTLIAHYSRQQDWGNVAQFWVRRQKAGFKINKWARRALAAGGRQISVLEALAETMAGAIGASTAAAGAVNNTMMNNETVPNEVVDTSSNSSLAKLAKERDQIGPRSLEEQRRANVKWKKQSRLLGVGVQGHISAFK